ncbi:TIGR04076 family protein [Chloroflexota bacterium]
MTQPERLVMPKPIIGTIKSMKRECSAGMKVGDKYELSWHSSGGLCGTFYHDLFPIVTMLQFGGEFPWTRRRPESERTVTRQCVDRRIAVTIELERQI